MADTLNGIFFSEILADNAGSSAIDIDGDNRRDKSDEFVELTNSRDQAQSLDGLQVWSEKNGLLYTFGPGDSIAAGGTAVIVGDYAGTPPPGYYDAGIGRNGNFLPDGENTKFDTLFLLDTTANPPTYIALSYGDPPRAPTLPDGFPTDAVQRGGGEAVSSNAPNGTSILRDANGTLVEGAPDPGAPGTLCLTGDALVATLRGPRRADTLAPGDMVICAQDGRARPLRAIGMQRLSRRILRAAPHLRPVRVECPDGAGSVELSPSHRVRIQSAWTDLMFGGPVLVAAKWLLGTRMGHPTDGRRGVTYVHLLFDDHVILRANGIAVESLFLGDVASGWIDACRAARTWREIGRAMTAGLRHAKTALPCLRQFEAQALFSLDARFAQAPVRTPVAA